MHGRVCLITGATGGIGLATAQALSRLGADLILHGRDTERLHAAVASVKAVSAGGKVRSVVADLASLESVRHMAADVNETREPLHVLINNAGVFSLGRRLTKDGFELQFGVNHLAHFLLTNLLLEKLKASGKARVVCVASRAHLMARFDLEDLQSAQGLRQFLAYPQSKLANILFAKELARRLVGTDVTCNALHPGLVATGMLRAPKPPLSWAMAYLRQSAITPEEGAKTSVYLASAAALEGVTGKYFAECQEQEPSPSAGDDRLARGLWEKSARLVGLA